MPPSNIRPRRDLSITLTFVALLLWPVVAVALGGGRSDDAFINGIERRTVATIPPHTDAAADYSRAVERVIADRFPLRTNMIESYDWLKFSVFDDSSSPVVMRGRDGWLFLGEPQVRAYISGAYDPPNADLDYIVQVYRSRADFCRAHGARYVVAFAPDKSSVYPEYLPAGMRLNHPTVLERLVPRLRAAGVDTLDLTAAVVAAKEQGDVFSHGDTHWNARGAYAGYRVLADDLRWSGLHVIPPGVVQEVNAERGGDLLNLSGVGAIIHDHQVDAVFPQRSYRIETPQYAQGGPAVLDPNASVVDDPSLSTAVFFGDSFSIRLRPFISEGFRRVVYVQSGQPFDDHLVVAEHPAVVIQELVERNLLTPAVQ
jgi:hypothetical protein